MSIKDLFDRNFLPTTTEKDAYKDIESADNLKAIKRKQESFLPQVDYSDPQSFAKFGSANLYYKSALDRIINFYPYDGSGAEITNFYNQSLDIEKYLFNSRYPRTTGYITLSPSSTAVTTTWPGGYSTPSVLEYITFNGGPNVLNETGKLSTLLPDPTNNQFQYNNIYDDDLYINNGYPSGYGSGTRLSNLRSNFDTGVTIEFWAQSGSINSADVERQVVFDMWNNNASASLDQSYGRIRIELASGSVYGTSQSPFLITVQSGTLSASAKQINTASIGTPNLSHSLSEWGHYAFVLENSGSDFKASLYVNGELNDTNVYSSTNIGELPSKNMQGRISGLLTAPSYLADTSYAAGYAGAGKLSGSLDEFRFWKVARNAEEIGRNWFDQVRGGTNLDIANTTLGMYYKFNEGITQHTTIDSVVLDYGGRLCNGTWTGYSADSRNTGSAIVSASASESEYLDPIIYAVHPDVESLRAELKEEGLYHDGRNNGQFLNLIPSWVVEEVEDEGNSDLEQVSHIMGAYFDKLYLQISALPSFRHGQYTSASHEPIPFAQHLPQSLGLYTPEIFVDSKVLEKFGNRTDTELFQEDLNQTKNLIYQNLYNNLTTIFKSKGTNEAVRNILRCFNIDDNLVYFNAYADNQTYELKNNLRQTQKKRKRLNFNTASSQTAVMYQAADPAYPDSQGYISGTQAGGHEDKFGFTMEASVLFPRFFKDIGTTNRNFLTSSLFGLQTVHTGSAADSAQTTALSGGQDVANFQVYAIRDDLGSKNVRFMLTSSFEPYPFDALTSSLFYSVYGNQSWDLSVALRPTNYPYSDLLSGSDDYSYDVVFRGYNNNLGTISNSFELSASVSKADGQSLLRSWKRTYAGAQNVNVTGTTNIHKSDVLFNGVKYWTKYVDNTSLKQHALDRENSGISGSYRNISALTSSANDIYNFATLALNWHFGTITGSDAGGNFYATDLSSGSATIRQNYGWVGSIAGYVHPGKGHGFKVDSEDVVRNELVNEFKFIDPEIVIGSDMINILSEDDELFGLFDEVPNYSYTIEKSLYAAISEEILDYFAGVIDFNNMIGDPVHRYRMEYKPLELLREIFFDRFGDVKSVEKFTEYFRWFDDAIANIIQQVVPASANFVPDMYNTVESHVLERNKYQSKFPTMEFKDSLPEGVLTGIDEKVISYMDDLFGGVELSPRPTNVHKGYWKKRAQPGAKGVGSYEISSGDAEVDSERAQFRNIMWSKPMMSSSQVVLSTDGGVTYTRNRLLGTQLLGVAKLNIPTIHRTIRGGVNFEPGKSIHYTYASLYPAGPVNTVGGTRFIPENVLYAETSDLANSDYEIYQSASLTASALSELEKRKRYLGVVQGRDYDEGLGYTHTSNTFAFPFNILSSSISGGVDKLIQTRATASITITNLHNDVYGWDLEVPLQGPFTDYAVGGHQSRHVKLNASASGKISDQAGAYSGLDDYTSRPEAWKIMLGKLGPCPGTDVEGAAISGAIGMVGADYPWPEANEVGATPYPMTASQKAVYYRDFIAKRPVNIRNIRLRSGSTILGNYQHNYEIVMTNGAWDNPRNFVETQPPLPEGTFQETMTSSTQVGTFLDIHRDETSHHEWLPNYSISYLTSAASNSTVILNRFAAPGGYDQWAPMYRDFRSTEYTPYATINLRNLTVLKNSQAPSGNFSEPVGFGTPGIRVFDIHGRDVGLVPHYARHTARFGRDSVTLPAIPYNLTTSMYIRSPSVYTYNYSSGLQGWWRLNENVSSAGNVADSSGNGRDGTFDAAGERPLFDDTSFPNRFIQTASCTFQPADTDATKIGTPATWDAIIGNNTGDGSTEKMTFSAWIYKTGDGGFNVGRIIDFGDSDISVFTDGDDELRFSARWSTGVSFWQGDVVFSQNEWVHVAVTYDATDRTNIPKMYVNGIEATVTNTSGAPGGGATYSGISTEDCYIGNSSDGDVTFEGNLADIAVWNTILTADDLQAIYEVGNIAEDNSITETSIPAPGASYDQLPGFHKVHRNNLSRIKLASYGASYTGPATLVPSRSYAHVQQYDNLNVHHPIPRSTLQYAWITGAMESTSSYYAPGFTPRNYLVRNNSTTAYVDPINFASASDYGTYWKNTTGERFFGTTELEIAEDANRIQFVPVDFAGLNTIIYEILTASSNTLGYPTSTKVAEPTDIGYGTFKPYLNPDSIYAASLQTSAPRIGTPAILNGILLNRNGPYGWPSWKPLRQQNHPILRNERLTNTLSTMYLGNVQRNFDLPPVSMKGQPVHLNMSFATAFSTSLGGFKVRSDNATLKTSYNNEMIGFNEWQLNNFTQLNFDSEVTPFEQLVAMQNQANVQLNWILYKENIIPSTTREFVSSSTSRVGFNNRFWRESDADRVTAGIAVSNSCGVNNYTDWDEVTRYITQSVFCLDAPDDFMTRTGPPVVSNWHAAPTSIPSYFMASSLIVSNSAGELQNTYSSYYFTTGSRGAGANLLTYYIEDFALALSVKNAALYSRKHMLNSPLSLNSPNGLRMIDVPLGTDNPTPATINRIRQVRGIEGDPQLVPVHYGLKVPTGSGEALWEAGRQAGYITMSVDYNTSSQKPTFATPQWVSAPSEPWYDKYDDFRQDIKTLAKGYAVLPEYRASEQVEDYVTYGPLGGDNFNTFTIPGTTFSSSQTNFYKDYSNSDFLRNFLDIKQMSDLEAKEIRLTCRAAIKFNPYNGFYPAQRAMQLVNQFSKSFSDSVVVSYPSSGSFYGETDVQGQQVPNEVVSGGLAFGYAYARPLMQPLFAPGILFNSIKSGLAVDYPVVTDGNKVSPMQVTGTTALGLDNSSQNWMLGTNHSLSASSYYEYGGQNYNLLSYISGAWWDKRVPFEAIMDPVKYLNGLEIPDIEPHPSIRLPNPVTASLHSTNPGTVYKMMASNFFAEAGKFFLRDQGYTKLKGRGVSLGSTKFAGNEIYGARLKMKTSYDGARSYNYESGSDGTNGFYSSDGCMSYFKNMADVGLVHANIMLAKSGSNSGSFALPQDPSSHPYFKQNFIMYSRTTAFGPPASGRVFGTSSGGHLSQSALASGSSGRKYWNDFAMSASAYGVKDSLNGYNWAFTPPYYHGEAWVDFIFTPSASVDYDLERILSETRIVKRRYDPGPDLLGHKKMYGFYRRTLVSDYPPEQAPSQSSTIAARSDVFKDNPAFPTNFTPYASENINDNAMHLDSCLNLFGIEQINKTTFDKHGNETQSTNEPIGARWVIGTKFETPMMNFSETGVHPISASCARTSDTWLSGASNLTLPTNFGSSSVPRGMWHQFGSLPESADKGIFLEMDDIPTSWLKYHYDVVTGSSLYNRFSASIGPTMYKEMKSFSNLMGFTEENSSVRLGEVADYQTIREAVVAVPYLVEGLGIGESQPSGQNAQTRKKFINIPKKRYEAALEVNTIKGNSLDTAGISIRKMVEAMDRYVFPPQFDFKNDKQLDPIVMYLFEFEYKLDQNDLAYIWQNLAPRNYKKLTLQKESVAHTLANTELLTEQNLLANPNLRWMVFKVKQRGQSLYPEMITPQAGEPSHQLGLHELMRASRSIAFNWPYDYISIVESAKVDAEVRFGRTANSIGTAPASAKVAQENQTLSKKARARKRFNLEKIKKKNN